MSDLICLIVPIHIPMAVLRSGLGHSRSKGCAKILGLFELDNFLVEIVSAPSGSKIDFKTVL
jgi:hypothetical protein